MERISKVHLFDCVLQVIYNLNTKNDEHEEFVQRLRSLHEAEVQRLLADSGSRLERYQKDVEKMREAGERKEGQLRERVKEVEKERDHLMETQVGYDCTAFTCNVQIWSNTVSQVAEMRQVFISGNISIDKRT